MCRSDSDKMVIIAIVLIVVATMTAMVLNSIFGANDKELKNIQELRKEVLILEKDIEALRIEALRMESKHFEFVKEMRERFGDLEQEGSQ